MFKLQVAGFLAAKTAADGSAGEELPQHALRVLEPSAGGWVASFETRWDEARRFNAACTSDALIHPLHVEHPDWVCVVNIANGPAVASARNFLEMAVREKALVHGFHFPWPGLGHILQKGDGWQWQPLGI